jgi:ketosteroid isomerase-like protein
LSDLKTDLDAWCQSYVAAFNSEDAEAIAAHWTFPAVTTQKGRSYAFKSADHFAKNTSLLLGFYRAQRVDRVARRIVDVLALHQDAVSLTVADAMFTDDGTEIVHWQAAYVLQRIDGNWKAVMAVADGETEAWAARGTPLGG